MECSQGLLDILIPAGAALAGVVITLIVQGFFELRRNAHEANIGRRMPLTSACEELTSLLNEQASALSDLMALISNGIDASTHPSTKTLAEKPYRKKLWVIIEDQKCVKPINSYAAAMESILIKVIAREIDDDILEEINNAKNDLGKAMKMVTKHTAEIWELEVVRE